MTAALKERGMPIPETLTDAPRLHTSLLFYWTAFWELFSCRSVGFKLGPIPWTAINEYGKRFGIVELEDFEILSDLMFTMDKKYFEIVEKLKPVDEVKK